MSSTTSPSSSVATTDAPAGPLELEELDEPGPEPPQDWHDECDADDEPLPAGRDGGAR